MGPGPGPLVPRPGLLVIGPGPLVLGPCPLVPGSGPGHGPGALWALGPGPRACPVAPMSLFLYLIEKLVARPFFPETGVRLFFVFLNLFFGEPKK